MRVRLLRNIRMKGSGSVELLAGNIVNTRSEIASEWIKQGVAMEDKSLDGASEHKDIAPTNPVPRKKHKRKTK